MRSAFCRPPPGRGRGPGRDGGGRTGAEALSDGAVTTEAPPGVPEASEGADPPAPRAEGSGGAFVRGVPVGEGCVG
jgi:hypothetical protein